jgi:uncharacterized protein YndB with AHSA1/START domain
MTETSYELSSRQLPAGTARCAIFRRGYQAPIADVWDACTDPARLSRWYAPVEGDLRVGGSFNQGNFGVGTVLRCEAPRLLTVALGGGDPATDQIELRLIEAGPDRTELEFEHATTLSTHEIGGQIFDAVYCMGGGYGPRLISLELHLKGELPELDPSLLHQRPEFGAPISSSMAALAELLDAAKLDATKSY